MIFKSLMFHYNQRHQDWECRQTGNDSRRWTYSDFI